MIKLIDILNEVTGDTFQMYHGGNKWITPPEIRPSKNGRYEGGVGIYLTNDYDRARKYAKGSNVVQIVDVDKNFKDLKDTKVPLEKIIEFLNSVHGLKKRKEIINDLQRVASRTGNDIRLTTLNNLIVNWQSGSGDVGIQLKDFFVQNGADANLQDQSGDEYWLVVFNPKIIKKYSVVDSKRVTDYILPKGI